MISCNDTHYFMEYRTNNEKLQKPRAFIKIIRGKVKEENYHIANNTQKQKELRK